MDLGRALPRANGRRALPRANGRRALPRANGCRALPRANGRRALPRANGCRALPRGTGRARARVVQIAGARAVAPMLHRRAFVVFASLRLR
jgi:hypothetical protein